MFDMDMKITGVIGEKKLAESGYSIDDLEGKTIDEAYSDRPDMRYFYRQLWRRALEGFSNIVVMPHKDRLSLNNKETVWHQTIIPLYNDEGVIRGGLAISKDITEEADQIGEIRKQKDILYGISRVNSHELLAEVARIQGLLELILDEKPTLSKKGVEYFNKIKQPIKSLRKIAEIIDGLASTD